MNIDAADIRQRITSRFPFDHWLPDPFEGFVIINRVRESRDFRKPHLIEGWHSIGAWHEGVYCPLWDIYLPTPESVEAAKEQLRLACQLLGYRVAAISKESL